MSLSEPVPFTKLEALGNDFVLIDTRSRTMAPEASAVRYLADRRRGIGFDQLLLIRPATDSDSHCTVDIFNGDGGRAEQCGNGMRAVGLWLHQRGEIGRETALTTAGGRILVEVDGEDDITATLGVPEFTPAACGLDATDEFPWRTEVGGEPLEIYGASLGNPHLLVVQTERPNEERLLALGSRLSRHPALAAGANLGVAATEGEDRIHLRVYERGAGPTMACGSGACAAAVILARCGRTGNSVEVVQPGGTLVVNWRGEGHPVRMKGPARQVFEGVIAWPTNPT